MTTSYFRHTRTDIEPLLPDTASRIVDVGCGVGATGAWLKTVFPKARVIGIEGNPELKPVLDANVDESHIVNLNTEAPSVGNADLVLYLDVLEHLHAPEKLLKEMLQDILPSTRIIVSLPNVAHYTVSVPLFLFGRFEYQDAGILDRTHVRFYVRESAIRLLNDAGLHVVRGLEAGFRGRSSRILDRITFGFFRSRLAQQYILLAMPMQHGRVQNAVPWSPAYPPWFKRRRTRT